MSVIEPIPSVEFICRRSPPRSIYATIGRGQDHRLQFKWIDASTQAWEELTIPILYLDKDAKPAEGNCSLVISTAASALGDYLCGSTGNQLCFDDFGWVY